MMIEPVTNQPQEMMVTFWKQQLDTTMRVIEAATEASEKMREMQLAAAVDAHASAFATQKTLGAASNAADLLRIESEWMLGNLGKSVAYWRKLCETAIETNAEILKCVGGQAWPAGARDSNRLALTGMIEAASAKWLEAAQSFTRMPVR